MQIVGFPKRRLKCYLTGLCVYLLCSANAFACTVAQINVCSDLSEARLFAMRNCEIETLCRCYIFLSLSVKDPLNSSRLVANRLKAVI